MIDHKTCNHCHTPFTINKELATTNREANKWGPGFLCTNCYNKKKQQQQNKAEQQLDQLLKPSLEYEHYGPIPDQNLPTKKQIQLKTLEQLAAKQTRQATETIVQHLEKTNHYHTLRSHLKPEIWIYKKGIYQPEGEAHIKEQTRKILGHAHTNHLTNEILEKIRADTYIDQNNLFNTTYPNQIPVQNGILNTQTLQLEPFTPNKIFFNKLPVTYNPQAKCPKIKQFFKQITKHPEDIPLLEEIIGYCLDTNKQNDKAIMLTGTGANGKSQYLTLIKNILGPENTSELTLTDLEKNFGKENLIHKLANISADLPANALKETSYFKALTGGDWISADRKFLTRISFKNYAKLLYSANEIPVTYDTSDAFFRRWIILEFPHKFLPQQEYDQLPEEQKTENKIATELIAQKISTPQELSGLLNLTLKALHRLKKQGGFSRSKTTEETQKMWLRKSSSFEAFFMDNLEESWDDEITKKEMRQAFLEYCKTHKLKGASDKAIKYILAEHGVIEARPTIGGQTERVWSGVKFKTTNEKILQKTEKEEIKKEENYLQNEGQKTLKIEENYLQNEGNIEDKSCQGCQGCQGISSCTEKKVSRGDSNTMVRLAKLVTSPSPGVLKRSYRSKTGRSIVSNIYIVGEKQDIFSKKDILDYMFLGGCKISAKELDEHFKEFLQKGVLMEVKPGLFRISVEKSV